MKDNIIEIGIKESEQLPKMVRAKTLCKAFDGISQSTIDNWVTSGLLSRHRICGSVFYELSEVIRLIKNSKEHRQIG